MRPAEFSLATWNVNSIRIRAPLVIEWLKAAGPDVLALQELKTEAAGFPEELFREAGYSAHVHGQKTWNGVALLSRRELAEVRPGLPGLEDDPQARFLSARLGDVRLIGVYVPNGAEVGSEPYAYKLRWLDALCRHFERDLDPAEPLALLGDFNIAPAERDLHDPEAFRGRVLFSEPERAAFERLLAWGLEDLFRRFEPGGGHYTWWDYRQAAFRRNLGARIDLILATRSLAERALACAIDAAPRKAERPSDHAPVLASFGG